MIFWVQKPVVADLSVGEESSIINTKSELLK